MAAVPPPRWGALRSLLLAASFFVSPLSASGSDARAVEAVLSEPDGCPITITDLRVDRIAARNDPPYFVVRDWFNPSVGLVVLCRPPAELRTGSTVDISGTMATLPNGERCVTLPTVRGLIGRDGTVLSLPPSFACAAVVVKPVLDLPTGPVPPVDPTDTSMGSGVEGEVTAVFPGVSRFPTVSSLASASLPVLAPVELSCAPVGQVGDGFIVVGDDSSDAAVKVYTPAEVKPKDRVLRLSATVHTESGSLVLYAGSGPEPYFDAQGFVGGITTASPGTVAYAASLPDTRSSAPSGIGVASTSPPEAEDGNWVYLTGRVVTGVGHYYTGGDPEESTNVYYVQAADKLPGIRVWMPDGESAPAIWDVVDIMAEVHTADGERMLGDGSDTASVERVDWKTAGSTCGAYPVFMIGRSLGGADFGYNFGVTDGTGLNNIGARVRTTGKVVGKGYCYDTGWGGDAPYIQIDDGSSVSWDGSWLEGLYQNNTASEHGVVVLDPPGYGDIDLYDYVSVTGISSLWIPNEGDSYRTIRFPTELIDLNDPPPPPQMIEYADIPIDLRVYGSPSESYTVNVFTNTGKRWTRTVDCDEDGVGTDTFTWSNVPYLIDYVTYLTYAVSAQCEGFKTRTDTNLMPGQDTAKLYLVLLRKVCPVETTSYQLDPCGTSSATLSTYVRNADHAGIQGQQVKFWTSSGTFASDGSQQFTKVVDSGAGGYVETTLYAGYSSYQGYAFVMATDDLNAPEPYGGNPYEAFKLYDWVALANEGGVPSGQNIIDIDPYYPTLTVTPPQTPAPRMKWCDELPVVATLESCDPEPAGQPVDFEITTNENAFFEETGTGIYHAQTNESGVATATVVPIPTVHSGSIYLTVSASPHGHDLSQYRTIEIKEFSPDVTVTPDPPTIHEASEPLITFHATNLDDTPRQGFQIQASASAGSLRSHPDHNPLSNPTTLTTNANGDAQVYVLLDPAESAVVSGSFTDDCLGPRSVQTTIRYCLAKWQDYGVNYSSPLVADLIPGDDGIPEVALIAACSVDPDTEEKTPDGRIRLWRADGTAVSVSDEVIDSDGNNTLSAGNVDNDDSGILEITAPSTGGFGTYGVNDGRVFAYGYDGTAFKPLAGWPVASPYGFTAVAAALGDANLDGTTKAAAGDLSCVATCWNACGDTSTPSEGAYGRLWRQLLYSTNVGIDYSSVALGDVHKTSEDAQHMPDAVVGSQGSPTAPFAIWGFAGNEWHDYLAGSTYRLTDPWNEDNSQSTCYCSPLIADIDGDGFSDVAVGDNSGTIWLWLTTDTNDPREWVSYAVAGAAIKSSPVVADLDGDPCLVFGSEDGKVYAIHADGTEATGWTDGISLPNGDPVTASLLYGKVVVGASAPQVIAASTDGNLYALWKDGTNHAGGVVAKTWTCAQDDEEQILATPSLCSLDGTHLDMIVASTDGIYRINFPDIEYSTTDHPWRTFHYDAARTGCTTPPTTTMVSASVVGRLKTSGGTPIEAATVELQYWTGGAWSSAVPVYQPASGQTETRLNPVLTAGDGTANNEINEGGFVFDQLTPDTRYRLAVTYQSTTRYFSVYNDQNLPAGLRREDVTWQ